MYGAIMVKYQLIETIDQPRQHHFYIYKKTNLQ